MRLCTNCKWFKRDTFFNGRNAVRFGQCASPRLGIDVSTGENNEAHANSQRDGLYSLWGLAGCGPWGFWWEPKAVPPDHLTSRPTVKMETP